MNTEQDLCNTNFWLGHPIFTDLSTDIFKNITFFNVPGYELWSTNTPIHMLAEYILDRVSTALNHFSSELEGVVLYKMTDKVHGIHQFGNKWSRLLPKTNKSSVMEFSSFAIGMGPKFSTRRNDFTWR